jgi:hypothetical protein
MLPPFHDVIPQQTQSILFGRGAKPFLRLVDGRRHRKASEVFEVVKLLPGPGTALLAVAPSTSPTIRARTASGSPAHAEITAPKSASFRKSSVRGSVSAGSDGS